VNTELYHPHEENLPTATHDDMAYKRPRAEFDQPPNHPASFALYGKPLPPLDSSTRDDGSYVPIWKQEVVDERGRKRLHGAFTGGFSAGLVISLDTSVTLHEPLTRACAGTSTP
jgi:hypothetical protein